MGISNDCMNFTSCFTVVLDWCNQFDGDFLVDGYNIIYHTNDELKVVKCIYMYASCSGGAVG